MWYMVLFIELLVMIFL